MRRRDGACGQGTGGDTERQARAEATRLRRSRRDYRRGADSTNGRQNSQCLLDHHIDPPLRLGDQRPAPRIVANGTRAAEGTRLNFPQEIFAKNFASGGTKSASPRWGLLEKLEHKRTPSTSSDAGGVFALASTKELPMPAWLEVLLDLAGFAGFLAIANWPRSPRKGGKPARRAEVRGLP
jgi:hypothetical protein